MFSIPAYLAPLDRAFFIHLCTTDIVRTQRRTCVDFRAINNSYK